MSIIDSSTLLYCEDVIRDEKFKDIANKITCITTTQEVENKKNRWALSKARIEETPTRDEVFCKLKRPQSLSILSTVPSIISVVKKKSATSQIERGAPDGGDCAIDEAQNNYCNKTIELKVKLPSEEILHSKSGWLLKEDQKGEWAKYWFSLKGGGLFYYRDPSAEDRAVLDGVLDVNSITSIKEITSNRNYVFQLTVI